jgi:hypothetical protein
LDWPGGVRGNAPAADIEYQPGACPVSGVSKGGIAMLYGEPETSRFLAAVQRIKRLQRKRERLTRQAKQRIRAVLRKMREC